MAMISSKKALQWVAILGLASMTAIAQAADPASMSVADISTCMRANVVDRGSLRDFQIASTDREGKTNTIKVKVFWKPAKDSPDERITLQVVEPETLAGTSYLLVTDGQADTLYLYLPALQRVQPVASNELSQKLWGSDFTLADVKQVQGLLLDGEAKRLADVVVANRPAYLIETTTNLEQTGYRKVLTYVDQESCTLTKTELFSDGETPHKILEADISTLLKVDPYWLMLGYRMTDHRTGTHTDLKLSDIYILERLPETLFTPDGFYTKQE
ncbi:MAG: outer membrane lipoprotein-sorting protein [Gammaproteobacteria bacterium]|jgi:hypothetical protein|nr:MAG: outer membrane lipoprotein-sorting protein [Gammaproteobacteria bacterium]